jgi:hypothetical protein
MSKRFNLNVRVRSVIGQLVPLIDEAKYIAGGGQAVIRLEEALAILREAEPKPKGKQDFGGHTDSRH